MNGELAPGVDLRGVNLIREWLDAEAGQGGDRDKQMMLRVLKITEEAGEVAEALHGALGGNPRKGHSHTWEDVEKELVDVAVTTLVALSTLNPEGWEKALGGRLQHLVGRIPGAGTEG
ncbi:MazG-like family protein [Streptomyces sp. NPDC048290]|uniref:MazG-like family protein n=1 Tax=Streptomyces sp. NPDC048290 TaxID=3155811 RepID=UPI003425A67F